MAYWTPEEGVALALGMEPRLFNSSSLADADRTEEKVKNFFDWLEFAERAVEMDHLAEKCAPDSFLDWLSAIGLAGDLRFFDSEFGDLEFESEIQRRLSPIDYRASYEGLESLFLAKRKELEETEEELQELEDQLQVFVERQDSQEPKRVYKKLDDRKRKTLLKIVLAVSIEKYRYNPCKAKNTAPARIETTTRLAGLEVSDETIRGVLAEAVKEFPEVINFFEDE